MTAPAPVPVPDVAALCDQLEQLRAAASKPPWGLVGGTHDRAVIDDHGCHVATAGIVPDAALIVALVNAAPTLIAAAREAAAVKAAVQRVEGLADEATRRLDWHIMVFDRGEARYVPLAELRRALDGGQP